MTVDGIALCGQPGSGKSAIAAALVEMCNGERLSFAAALKDELSDMLGGYDRYRREMDNVRSKDKYRPLLQALGAFRRDDDKNYWVRAALAGVTPNMFYAVDDCRYDNEYEALRNLDFVFVYLEPGPTTRPLSGEQANHPSELEWPHFNFDVHLEWEKGPEHQATRLLYMLGIYKNDVAA